MFKRLNKSVFILFVAILSISFVSCGGGGGGTANDGGNPGLISGRVEVVGGNFTAIESKKELSIFSYLKNMISSEAVAQSNGVTVNVIQNGEVIDTTVTDDDGNFVVEGAGDVTLQFITSGGSTITVDISIPSGTVITLNVTIDEGSEVATVNEFRNGIQCDDGDININEDQVFINGNGEDDCIATEGSCSVNINSPNVVLTNCERCIDTDDNSQVNISSGEIFCDSIEDGIRSNGNSFVNLDAAIIDIDGDDGIEADDDSFVGLSGNSCFISDDISEDDNAVIDTINCTELVVSNVDDDDTDGINDDDSDSDGINDDDSDSDGINDEDSDSDGLNDEDSDDLVDDSDDINDDDSDSDNLI